MASRDVLEFVIASHEDAKLEVADREVANGGDEDPAVAHRDIAVGDADGDDVTDGSDAEAKPDLAAILNQRQITSPPLAAGVRSAAFAAESSVTDAVEKSAINSIRAKAPSSPSSNSMRPRVVLPALPRALQPP